MDSYHAVRVTRQVKCHISHQSIDVNDRPRVMVHEGEVGNLNLTIVDREHFCVNEFIVTHIVNLDATLMVSLEVLDHVLLAVTK